MVRVLSAYRRGRVAVLAALFTAITGCSSEEPARNGQPPPGGSAGAAATYESWNAFLAEGTPSHSAGRVVFIGVDGAAWNIIDPLIASGELPTFERLKREGAWGVLNSVDCYVSPPAWTTMTTGYLPHRTGIYTFGHWQPSTREFTPLSSTDVAVPAIWDATTLAGLRTAVVNVPLTFPVRAVDGIMISGLMTPMTLAERHAVELVFSPAVDRKDLTSNAPILHGALDHAGNRFDFYLGDASDDGAIVYDRVRVDITPMGSRTALWSHEFDVGPYSPWLEMGHPSLGGRRKAWGQIRVRPASRGEGEYIVRFSDILFAADDTDIHFTSPDSIAGVLARQFGHYFPSRFLDAEAVPPFTDESIRAAEFLCDYDDWDLFFYVFTQTDNTQHLVGDAVETRQVYRKIDAFLGRLLQRLPEDVTLIVASDHGFKEYAYGVDLNKLFEGVGLLHYKAGRQIDHDRTVAFHNLWGVYLNDDLATHSTIEGRGGQVPDGMTPREALLSYIESIGLVVPRGGQRIELPIEFQRIPTGAVGESPDLIVTGTYSNYMIDFWNLKRPQAEVIRPLAADEKWYHTREGIFIVRGPGVSSGHETRANIQDIAPTILHRLGLPIAVDMDGKVIPVFGDGDPASNTPATVAGYAVIDRPKDSVDDERSLEKQLRTLGYIR